ncbi:MAG: phage holin family protein [Patescibacteria group bacterium]
MKTVVKIVLIALVLLGITQYNLIPGISVSDFTTALVVSLVLAVLNLFIKPIVLLLTLPVNLLTLGLFTFVINALLFWLASFFVKGFEVSGFVAAFLGALVIAVFKWLVDRFLD